MPYILFKGIMRFYALVYYLRRTLFYLKIASINRVEFDVHVLILFLLCKVFSLFDQIRFIFEVVFSILKESEYIVLKLC